jgi:hypothetical protein
MLVKEVIEMNGYVGDIEKETEELKSMYKKWSFEEVPGEEDFIPVAYVSSGQPVSGQELVDQLRQHVRGDVPDVLG